MSDRESGKGVAGHLAVAVANLGRSQPWSDDAERGLLSCLLQNPADLCNDARARGMAEWFYGPVNRFVLEELLALEERDDSVVDLVTFSQWLIDRAAMDKVGGPGFLAELLTFVATPAHYPHYAGIVRNKWILRRSIEIGCGLINRAHEFQEDVMTALTAGESEMFEMIDIAQAAQMREGGLEAAGVTLDRWWEHLEQVKRNKGKIIGISTGLNDLDRVLHGLDDSEGECLVLAARPGQGKTAAACSILDSLQTDGVRTAYFPIEMGTNRTWDRIALGARGIDTSKSITGMFQDAEWDDLKKYRELAKKADCLWMDGSPALNTAELRHRVKMAKRKHGIRVLMIDYLGLVDPVTEEGKEQERLALKEVMKTLHYLKRKFKLAVVLLVQLSRETDRNLGKPPVLADLAGSADIERYADHVLFIHRPCYFTSWARLKEEHREGWMKQTAPLREGNPDFWSDGRKCVQEEMERAEREKEEKHGKDARLTQDERAAVRRIACGRQDYEEHAFFYVRKNRRGPTPDLMLRFEPELTRFSSRTSALYTNRVEERQPGYVSKARGAADEDDGCPFD